MLYSRNIWFFLLLLEHRAPASYVNERDVADALLFVNAHSLFGEMAIHFTIRKQKVSINERARIP